MRSSPGRGSRQARGKSVGPGLEDMAALPVSWRRWPGGKNIWAVAQKRPGTWVKAWRSATKKPGSISMSLLRRQTWEKRAVAMPRLTAAAKERGSWLISTSMPSSGTQGWSEPLSTTMTWSALTDGNRRASKSAPLRDGMTTVIPFCKAGPRVSGGSAFFSFAMRRPARRARKACHGRRKCEGCPRRQR